MIVNGKNTTKHGDRSRQPYFPLFTTVYDQFYHNIRRKLDRDSEIVQIIACSSPEISWKCLHWYHVFKLQIHKYSRVSFFLSITLIIYTEIVPLNLFYYALTSEIRMFLFNLRFFVSILAKQRSALP